MRLQCEIKDPSHQAGQFLLTTQIIHDSRCRRHLHLKGFVVAAVVVVVLLHGRTSTATAPHHTIGVERQSSGLEEEKGAPDGGKGAAKQLQNTKVQSERGRVDDDERSKIATGNDGTLQQHNERVQENRECHKAGVVLHQRNDRRI